MSADVTPDGALAQASACLARGDARGAEHFFRQAIEIDETCLTAWNGLAAALGMQLRHEDAYRAAERALALDLDPYARDAAYVNAGVALRALERYDEALALYREWLPHRPRPDAHFDYACTLLALGRFDEAWSSFEQRWLMHPLFHLHGHPPAPPWRGQDLTDRAILIRCEQGLGDTIQFIRYAADLKARGATVYALVQPGLEPVVATVPGVDRVLQRGVETSYDFYVNSLSLPRLLRMQRPAPAGTYPYMMPDAGRRERWRVRLPAGRRVIGIAWSGNPSHVRDRERSIPLEAIRTIVQDVDAQFVSLQVGAVGQQSADALRAYGVLNLGVELETLSDTAALIAAVDLVISVDTAVAHLTGALGIPLWVLLARPAEWRWGVAGSATPWYPQAVLYRQATRGDWATPLQRIAADLRQSRLEGPAERSTEVDIFPAPAFPATIAADAVTDTPVGLIAFPVGGIVGRSLEAYGEYLHEELEILSAVIAADAHVIMLGTAAHTHPLALARGLAERGKLTCAELQPLDFQLLRGNLGRRGLGHVALVAGVSDGAAGRTLDRLAGERLDLVHLDCTSRLGLDNIMDATCLWALRPSILVHSVKDAAVEGLSDMLKTLGLRAWLVRTSYFRPGNYLRNSIDVFDGAKATAVIGVPEEHVPPDVLRQWPEL